VLTLLLISILSRADVTVTVTMTLTTEEDMTTKPSLSQSVRRCLFERPDADVMRHDLERAWTELALHSSAAWNFDFDQERPVAGPVLWTRCDGDVWLGRIASHGETQCASVSSSAVASSHTARQGYPPRRQMTDHTHTARVIRFSRLRQRRRQSLLTGSYCC